MTISKPSNSNRRHRQRRKGIPCNQEVFWILQKNRSKRLRHHHLPYAIGCHPMPSENNSPMRLGKFPSHHVQPRRRQDDCHLRHPLPQLQDCPSHRKRKQRSSKGRRQTRSKTSQRFIDRSGLQLFLCIRNRNRVWCNNSSHPQPPSNHLLRQPTHPRRSSRDHRVLRRCCSRQEERFRQQGGSLNEQSRHRMRIFSTRLPHAT